VQVTRTVVGASSGHRGQAPRDVHGYTLDTGNSFKVTVWTYGAALIEVLTPDRAGRMANVAVRLPTLASYQDRARNHYVGSVLGPYCRCVRDGRFSLDGVVHQLARNEGRHHLHGGPAGLDRFVWDAEAGRDGESLAVRLRLSRPAGDQGYPGALSAEVTYRATAGGRLSLEYRATTTATTIIGLTSHAFWNLSGGGTVNGHQLALNASESVMLDDDLIPLPGRPAFIGGTSLDYRTARPLGDFPLDNFYVLGDPSWAAELHDPCSGRRMRLVTDQPGLGTYTGERLSPSRAGICLQASAWPDAPNRPDFPSCRLDPGQVYRQLTSYAFTCGE
jgi:aldose 1-epimerase